MANAQSDSLVDQGGRFFGNFFNGVLSGVRGLASDMVAFQRAEVVIGYAQPGDMIEVQGKRHSHYCLYLGDGNVLNIDADEYSTITEARASVRTLEEVCDGAKARVRNHDDLALTEFKSTPRTVDEIVRAAKYYEGKLVPYQSDVRNCEYYCTFCRYGVGFSTQVAQQSSSMFGSFFGESTSTSPTLKDVDTVNGPLEVVEGDAYVKYKHLANSSSNRVSSANDETVIAPSDSIL